MTNHCVYNPSIWDNPDETLTPPPGTAPTLTPITQVTFVSGVNTLTLRRPELQDTHAHAVRRIYNRSFGGEPLVLGGQDWRRYEVFNFSITTACNDRQTDILDFLKAVKADLTTYTDYWSRSFDGVIRSYSNPIAEIHNDRFTVQFDFIGAPA